MAGRPLKRAVLVARGQRQNHQHTWAGAFADGLRRHGWEARVVPAYEPADLAVFWGVRQAAIATQRDAGGEVVILERGYIGDRFLWTSVSFGGDLNGRATFRSASDDPSRFEAHFGGLMRRWRHNGGYALIIGQVPGDMALAPVGGSLDGWYAAAAARLRRLGYEVRFRPHPLAPQHRRRSQRGAPIAATTMGGSLEAALAGAGLVVTFNSNAGVEAALAGVPTIATDVGSMAWPVATHRIDEAPARPDRAAWAARLAWCQWSESDMRSGECWARQDG